MRKEIYTSKDRCEIFRETDAVETAGPGEATTEGGRGVHPQLKRNLQQRTTDRFFHENFCLQKLISS